MTEAPSIQKSRSALPSGKMTHGSTGVKAELPPALKSESRPLDKARVQPLGRLSRGDWRRVHAIPVDMAYDGAGQVAVGALKGRPVFAVREKGSRGAIRVFDLETCQSIAVSKAGPPPTFGCETLMSWAQIGGRDVLLSVSGASCYFEMWDPLSEIPSSALYFDGTFPKRVSDPVVFYRADGAHIACERDGMVTIGRITGEIGKVSVETEFEVADEMWEHSHLRLQPSLDGKSLVVGAKSGPQRIVTSDYLSGHRGEPIVLGPVDDEMGLCGTRDMLLIGSGTSERIVALTEGKGGSRVAVYSAEDGTALQLLWSESDRGSKSPRLSGFRYEDTDYISITSEKNGIQLWRYDAAENLEALPAIHLESAGVNTDVQFAVCDGKPLLLVTEPSQISIFALEDLSFPEEESTDPEESLESQSSSAVQCSSSDSVETGSASPINSSAGEQG